MPLYVKAHLFVQFCTCNFSGVVSLSHAHWFMHVCAHPIVLRQSPLSKQLADCNVQCSITHAMLMPGSTFIEPKLVSSFFTSSSRESGTRDCTEVTASSNICMYCTPNYFATVASSLEYGYSNKKVKVRNVFVLPSSSICKVWGERNLRLEECMW